MSSLQSKLWVSLKGGMGNEEMEMAGFSMVLNYRITASWIYQVHGVVECTPWSDSKQD